jgi:hypothetical protein
MKAVTQIVQTGYPFLEGPKELLHQKNSLVVTKATT